MNAEEAAPSKNSLNKVWVATCDLKKLRRKEVSTLDIEEAVKGIVEFSKTVQENVLRVTAGLFLGIILVYQKKLHFLQLDCGNILQELDAEASSNGRSNDVKVVLARTVANQKKKKSTYSKLASNETQQERSIEELQMLPGISSATGDKDKSNLTGSNDWRLNLGTPLTKADSTHVEGKNELAKNNFLPPRESSSPVENSSSSRVVYRTIKEKAMHATVSTSVGTDPGILDENLAADSSHAVLNNKYPNTVGKVTHMAGDLDSSEHNLGKRSDAFIWEDEGAVRGIEKLRGNTDRRNNLTYMSTDQENPFSLVTSKAMFKAMKADEASESIDSEKLEYSPSDMAEYPESNQSGNSLSKKQLEHLENNKESPSSQVNPNLSVISSPPNSLDTGNHSSFFLAETSLDRAKHDSFNIFDKGRVIETWNEAGYYKSTLQQRIRKGSKRVCAVDKVTVLSKKKSKGLTKSSKDPFILRFSQRQMRTYSLQLKESNFKSSQKELLLPNRYFVTGNLNGRLKRFFNNHLPSEQSHNDDKNSIPPRNRFSLVNEESFLKKRVALDSSHENSSCYNFENKFFRESSDNSFEYNAQQTGKLITDEKIVKTAADEEQDFQMFSPTLLVNHREYEKQCDAKILGSPVFLRSEADSNGISCYELTEIKNLTPCSHNYTDEADEDLCKILYGPLWKTYDPAQYSKTPLKTPFIGVDPPIKSICTSTRTTESTANSPLPSSLEITSLEHELDAPPDLSSGGWLSKRSECYSRPIGCSNSHDSFIGDNCMVPKKYMKLFQNEIGISRRTIRMALYILFKFKQANANERESVSVLSQKKEVSKAHKTPGINMKRSVEVSPALSPSLNGSITHKICESSLSFKSMVQGNRREVVIGVFFEILILKSRMFVEIIVPEKHQDDMLLVTTEKQLRLLKQFTLCQS